MIATELSLGLVDTKLHVDTDFECPDEYDFVEN